MSERTGTMTLTLDVGNSNIVGGIFDGGKLVLQFRQTTSQNSSSDELGIFLRSVLRENSIDPGKIDSVGICSVVPPINYSLSSAILKYFGVEPLLIQSGIKTGLQLKYPNPKEIGADLIAGALGAAMLVPDKDLVIVDMGTATTITALTRNKEFLGGAIMPGLKISIQALADGTSKLPNVEIARPQNACGKSTIEAIQSGIFYGALGSLKELIYYFKKDALKNPDAFVIATGGFVKNYESFDLFDKIVPELVLLGIKKAIELNSSK